MSNQAREIPEITIALFEKLLKEQIPKYDTHNLKDIEIDKLYTVTSTKVVDTQNGRSMILSLINNGEVWATENLKNKIINSDTYTILCKTNWFETM